MNSRCLNIKDGELVVKIGIALLLLGSFVGTAVADVRLDVKNDTSEDCSVALHARTDKTRWNTEGWYVFVSGEEAPIIVENVDDIRNVYLYHDCGIKIPEDAERKRAYVKINRQFSDDIPKEGDRDYEEVTFVRLTTSSYIIESSSGN